MRARALLIRRRRLYQHPPHLNHPLLVILPYFVLIDPPRSSSELPPHPRSSWAPHVASARLLTARISHSMKSQILGAFFYPFSCASFHNDLREEFSFDTCQKNTHRNSVPEKLPGVNHKGELSMVLHPIGSSYCV
jgi:hypothetical protein